MIDEIQLKPELFRLLRPLVDENRNPGRYVILGSASPDLIRDANESLAGRVKYIELAPIGLTELPEQISASTHWLAGGYPNALFASDQEESYDWRESYLYTYITRELPALGSVGQPDTLRRLLSMLAAQQGELMNQSAYARSLGISQPSVRSYLDLLTQAFLITQLQPYHINIKKRLVKTPKVYVRDSGLLHVLNRIENEGQLRENILVGASWEGYVIEQIRGVVSPRAELFFYRTAAGAEMDLVIIGRQGRIACVEIKFSSSPALTKGFYIAQADISPEVTYVVAPVTERYSRKGDIEVLTLPDVLEELNGW